MNGAIYMRGHQQFEYNTDETMSILQSPTSDVVTDPQGLIVPKKILNPCLVSRDKKDLHRELLFNQKTGKNVLNQKSELQKALERQKERQIYQQQQQNKLEQKGVSCELGRAIKQRAQRLENNPQDSTNQQVNFSDNQLNPEYLNARAKLRATVDTK